MDWERLSVAPFVCWRPSLLFTCLKCIVNRARLLSSHPRLFIHSFIYNLKIMFIFFKILYRGLSGRITGVLVLNQPDLRERLFPGGVPPHVSHICTCRLKGYKFWDFLVWKRVYTLPILVWEEGRILKVRSENGVKNDIFWSEIGSGFGERGGTPPLLFLSLLWHPCLLSIYLLFRRSW